MTTKPVIGGTYRYIGNEPVCREHKGLQGVVSAIVRQLGKHWEVRLSNIKQWGELGLLTEIAVSSAELEPVPIPGIQESPYPIPPASGGTPYKGHESELVDEILDAAKERGYLCCAVGQNKAKGSGTTIGYPDLSFRRKGWPRGMACLIEVKAEGGKLSPEQTELFNAGWSIVTWSVDGALEALEEFEDQVLAWTSLVRHS